MRDLMPILLIMTWIAGVIMANGFISTLFAILFYPWALIVFVWEVLIAVGMA